MRKVRPFFKWAGSKYRCLDYVLASLPPAKRLIEPFTGSGVIFLNTQYSQYLLADTNSDLIHFYQLLSEQGELFINKCAQFFTEKNNQKDQYYNYRTLFNESNEKNLRATLFLYLNRHGYNGLCRYNRQGKYNVPFGRYKKPYFPHKELLEFYKKCKMSAKFLRQDFNDTFALAKKGDVIYCDPPYAPIEQISNFSSYDKKKFREAEQIQLAELAMKTAARGIPVIISNHDTPFTRQQYRDSEIHTFSVRRSINRDASSRHMTQELIAVFS